MLNVQEELDKFKDYVIKQSKSNLTRLKKNDRKGLYNTIKGEAKAMPNSFYLSFDLGEYGAYVDKGVKGADPSQVSPNAKVKGQQAPNSPYSFKTKKPPSDLIAKWAQRKNLRLRDKKGQYVKGSYKAIGFITAKNIWARGIKPSLFFTKPFEKAYKQLPDELVEKYGLDALELFKHTIKQPKK
jgi:hypothetical protein